MARHLGFTCEILDSREAMGRAAGQAAESLILQALDQVKDRLVRMIFAAAPSQNEILAYLAASKKIDWSRIEAFHMDEYIGLDKDAPQGFGNFLDAHIFQKVPFAKIHYLRPQGDVGRSLENYAELLKAAPIDICLMGIGENGHIAFNDPAVADFKDPKVVKVVGLDEVCRNQQVHDGCFKKLEDVPSQAVTLTVPMLFSANHIVCTVPAATKAHAARMAVLGPVAESCPSSILRLHADARLFLDNESGKEILGF